MNKKNILLTIMALIIIALSCEKEITLTGVVEESIHTYSTLNLTSNPTGAAVYMGGKNSGYNT